MYKNVFLYEITHRYLKNDYQFFDTLKIKHHKVRRNFNLLIKVKFHQLVWSSPFNYKQKYRKLTILVNVYHLFC